MRIAISHRRFWSPVGATCKYGRPEIGWLIAWPYDYRLWRVTDVRERDFVDWPDKDRDGFLNHNWRGDPTPETWHSRPYIVVLKPLSGCEKHWLIRPMAHHESWNLMPEPHTPLCSHCQQPYPCSAVMDDEDTTEAIRRMEEDQALPDGCCWSCREPITTRQKVITFEGENLFDPLRASPSFHLRRQCRDGAARYEKRWVAADSRRKTRLSCPGHITRHVVKSRGVECTEGIDCSGPLATHRSMCMCYVNHGVCLDGCPLPNEVLPRE